MMLEVQQFYRAVTLAVVVVAGSMLRPLHLGVDIPSVRDCMP